MSKSTSIVSNFRDLPNDELQTKLADIRDELFRLKLGMHTNQVTSTAALTTKRREIAKIQTILRARELNLEVQGSGAAAKPAAEAAPAEKTEKKATKRASKKKEA